MPSSKKTNPTRQIWINATNKVVILFLRALSFPMRILYDKRKFSTKCMVSCFVDISQ